jgi:UDP-N-acetylmuramoyl-L-alanyl-D-glutamate--2,6-diaminopimelate ligase
VIGTLGAALSDEVSLATNTTPDPLSLQRQLAEWHEQRIFAVSMEVSSHALEQGRTNGVEFETAVYTNLSHDHLDYHGSMDAYGRAKLRLFASENLRYAVINVDDQFAPRVRNAVTASTQVLTYSASGAPADLRIEGAQFEADGVRGRLYTPWGDTDFFSPLPGDFNLANLAAAVAALVLAGEDLLAVLDVLSGLKPVPGRMQTISNTLGLQVVVDYAHTPEALEQVLNALRPHVAGALITVFGCGGDRDKEKRQVMGRIACALSDRVVVTSDNPRGEDPLAIMRDVESGCTGHYVLVEDRAQAIVEALAGATVGDCVVIAGKGHEEYQLVDGERLRFSDEAQARDVLAGKTAL